MLIKEKNDLYTSNMAWKFCYMFKLLIADDFSRNYIIVTSHFFNNFESQYFLQQGIIQRDELVFNKARSRDIPIVMVTSGGYQRTTARIIADSILNLRRLGYVSCEAAEEAQAVQEAAEQRCEELKQAGIRNA